MTCLVARNQSVAARSRVIAAAALTAQITHLAAAPRKNHAPHPPPVTLVCKKEEGCERPFGNPFCQGAVAVWILFEGVQGGAPPEGF